MSKCKNPALLPKITLNKVSKTTAVTFTVLNTIDSCVKINAKNFTKVAEINQGYNRFNKPKDMVNCLPEGCMNTGTLTFKNVAPTEEKTSSTAWAQWPSYSDATDYAAGIVVFYVQVGKAGTYSLSTTISDLADDNQTNADNYTQSITVNDNGFIPIQIDLSKVPTGQKGNGWTPTTSGININVALTSTTIGLEPILGVSSFAFFDSLEEFEVDDTVQIACIDEMGGDSTLDAIEATCSKGGYDPTSYSSEFPITAKQVTPNYWKLNPLIQKGDKEKGWILTTVEETVQATTINGIDYGYVQVSDLNIEECGFTKAVIADDCNVTDSQLNKVSTPLPIQINQQHFIVLDGTKTNLADRGKILVHPDLIGNKVIVQYPKNADVEHFVSNTNRLDDVRVRMTYVQEQSDGVKNVVIFNNVLITSFPGVLNGEETSFSFTVVPQMDSQGNYSERFRIID